MVNNKKNKSKKPKTEHIYRTIDERKTEVRKIITQLNDLQLTATIYCCPLLIILTIYYCNLYIFYFILVNNYCKK